MRVRQTSGIISRNVEVGLIAVDLDLAQLRLRIDWADW